LKPVFSHRFRRRRDVVALEVQRVKASASGFDLFPQPVAYWGVTPGREQLDTEIVEPERHAAGFIGRIFPHPGGASPEQVDHFPLSEVEVLDSNYDTIGSQQHGA
jgi:hypothetical protein